MLHTGHRGAVTCLGALAEDKCFASGGDDGTIRVFDLRTSSRAPVGAIRLPGPCAAFVCTNRAIVSAVASSLVEYDLRALASAMVVSRATRHVAHACADDIGSVNMAPNGRALVTADDSGALTVFNIKTLAVVCRMAAAHASVASTAMYRPGNSNVILSGGLDCTVRACEVVHSTEVACTSVTKLANLNGFFNPPHVHTLDALRNTLIVGVGDGSLVSMGYGAHATLTGRLRVDVHNACVCHLRVLDKQALVVVSVANDASLAVTTMEQGRVLHRWALPCKPNAVLPLSTTAVLVAGVDGSVQCFNVLQ